MTGPLLRAVGHEVTGLDTFFYEGCDLREDADGLPALRLDLRDADPAALAGMRRSCISPRFRTTRSAISVRS